jgi:hypothetical protein
MNHHINFVRIKAVASALAEINEKIVFVGGAIISLYATRPVLEIRPTDDIDVIVEILNYKQRIRLEEKLLEIGFENVIDSNIICRYSIKGIIVDIMPTNDPSIGFTNLWYELGFKDAIQYQLDLQLINILDPCYFLATKIEAFKGRGNSDGRFSHDFEDIIFVLENRVEIWNEIHNCKEPLKTYIKKEFQNLVQNPYLLEWIDSHIERGGNAQDIYSKIAEIALE